MSELRNAIKSRSITEILHFTTELGFLGVIACKAVLPRSELGGEQLLEFIVRPNVDVRKDAAYVGYVSLSITQINRRFFSISEGYYNPGLNWMVLGFDPIVLTHSGVIFVTANNIWPKSKRGQGVNAFEALFANTVAGSYDNVSQREPCTPANLTTNREAEVLYPGRLGLEHLKSIYVRTEDEVDNVHAVLAGVGFKHDCAVLLDPGKFE